MKKLHKAQVREFLFRISVLLKGLDGLLEIGGGIVLSMIGPALIIRVIAFLTQDEIAEDPRDLVATYLRHAAACISVSSEHFMAIYLISHGIVSIRCCGAPMQQALGLSVVNRSFSGLHRVSNLPVYPDGRNRPHRIDGFRSDRHLSDLA